MGKYLLQKNLLTETGELSAGTIIELDDQEKIERFLERGTIVEAGEGVEITPQLTAFESAQKETAERDAVRLKDQREQTAREAEVRAAEEAKRDAPASEGEVTDTNPLVEQPVASVSEEAPQTVQPVEQQPSNPLPEQLNPHPGQPTKAEIEETLKASGENSGDPTSSKIDVQIS